MEVILIYFKYSLGVVHNNFYLNNVVNNKKISIAHFGEQRGEVFIFLNVQTGTLCFYDKLLSMATLEVMLEISGNDFKMRL